jgi:GDPmannose 4,6-dehydratase
MSKRVALITGITGQDGSYLSDFLLNNDKYQYEVHGIIRRTSLSNTTRIDKLRKDYPDRFFLHFGDMTDHVSLTNVLADVEPDEIYNLAAQSDVQVSFFNPLNTLDIDGAGAVRILESMRLLGLDDTKFYQASTSELYGKVLEIPQTELTPFYPRSPYSTAKLYAYWSTINYRESYGMFAVNGVLFNHESPLRGEMFVTRKITIGVARIHKEQSTGLKIIPLRLGNLEAKRDWGFAGDFIIAMWLMLQQDVPEDYVIATGETHSVREFAELAFKYAGFNLVWRGEGVNEKGYDSFTGDVLLEIDPTFYRPAEVDLLIGDSTKARNKLGWSPKVNFEDLVFLMVQADMKELNKAI